jgi:hypothetical protein
MIGPMPGMQERPGQSRTPARPPTAAPTPAPTPAPLASSATTVLSSQASWQFHRLRYFTCIAGLVGSHKTDFFSLKSLVHQISDCGIGILKIIVKSNYIPGH